VVEGQGLFSSPFLRGVANSPLPLPRDFPPPPWTVRGCPSYNHGGTSTFFFSFPRRSAYCEPFFSPPPLNKGFLSPRRPHATPPLCLVSCASPPFFGNKRLLEFLFPQLPSLLRELKRSELCDTPPPSLPVRLERRLVPSLSPLRSEEGFFLSFNGRKEKGNFFPVLGQDLRFFFPDVDFLSRGE